METMRENQPSESMYDKSVWVSPNWDDWKLSPKTDEVKAKLTDREYKVYNLLITRASAAGGDTKINETKFAAITSMSPRQFRRYIAKFLDLGLIAVCRKIVKTAQGQFRTIRIIRVFAAWQLHRFNPRFKNDKNGNKIKTIFKKDIRPPFNTKAMIQKIPIEWRIFGDVTICDNGITTTYNKAWDNIYSLIIREEVISGLVTEFYYKLKHKQEENDNLALMVLGYERNNALAVM